MIRTNLASTTRRALIGALIAAPAIAVVVPAAAEPVSSQAWDTALLTYRQAHAEHEAACCAYSDVQDAFYQARDRLPASGQMLGADTADSYNARENGIRAAEAELAATYGVDAAENREFTACHAAADAFDVLLTTPAPDCGAARIKLEIAMERGVQVEELHPLLADLARLGGLA